MNSNPHAGETLHFSTGVPGGFSELTATVTHYICPRCGDHKRAAIDVCTDPEHRCKEDA